VTALEMASSVPAAPWCSWSALWAVSARALVSVVVAALPSFAPALRALPWSRVAAAR
jgi:hypothetical protein